MRCPDEYPPVYGESGELIGCLSPPIESYSGILMIVLIAVVLLILWVVSLVLRRIREKKLEAD